MCVCVCGCGDSCVLRRRRVCVDSAIYVRRCRRRPSARHCVKSKHRPRARRRAAIRVSRLLRAKHPFVLAPGPPAARPVGAGDRSLSSRRMSLTAVPPVPSRFQCRRPGCCRRSRCRHGHRVLRPAARSPSESPLRVGADWQHGPVTRACHQCQRPMSTPVVCRGQPRPCSEFSHTVTRATECRGQRPLAVHQWSAAARRVPSSGGTVTQ